MPEVQQSTTVVSIQSHGELQHAQLVDKSPIGDLQDVGDSRSDLPPTKHAWLMANYPVGDFQGNYRRRGGASSSAMRNPLWKGFSSNVDQRAMHIFFVTGNSINIEKGLGQ